MKITISNAKDASDVNTPLPLSDLTTKSATLAYEQVGLTKSTIPTVSKFLTIPISIRVVALLLLASQVCSQQLIPDKDFPVPRDKPSFTYHPPSKSLLLVGGSTIFPDTVRNDVWKLNGTKWIRIEAQGPGARAFFSGGLNKADNQIYCYGGVPVSSAGLQLEQAKNDLWAFDGNTWSELTVDKIGSRHHHAMVFADHLDAFVLYGGFSTSGADTVTWLLKDGCFTALKIPGPGVRYQSSIAYDPKRKKVIIYGGGNNPSEHWEFDGERWTQIRVDKNPGVKFRASIAYDASRGKIVMHAGQVNLNMQDPENHNLPDTWTWDGTQWEKIASASVFPIAMTYDPKTKSLLAYGFDEGNPSKERGLALWQLKKDEWRKLTDYGKWNTLNYLAKCVEQNENDVDALKLYASGLRAAGQYEKAEGAYKKLQHRFPNDSNLLTALAHIMASQAKYKEATDYYEQAVALSPNANDFYNLACIYSRQGDINKCFENLDKAVSHGFNSRKDLESDPDLAQLKSDSRWNLLIEKLDQPD
ncbi:MAG TPA: tetratricopeptide repeat protein [Chryseosolibacter sp.]|nr:tetratricopeptide repeat protein [Chryseosolibacter sp.]